MTTQHETAISQDTIDLVASALESADIGHSMCLTRLVDGIHTYTLKIHGEIETFVDSDEANAIDLVYARIREVKHRLQAEAVIAALRAPLPIAGKGDERRAFALGDRVRKTKGSSWQGRVVGFYSTDLTTIGYCVESEREPGSVQIYPESALEALPATPSLLSEDTEGGV